MKTFILDEDYSTTRLVTKGQPVIEEKPEDKCETVLFSLEGQDRQGEGGLRKQGYFKTSQPDKPLITVVTVVYNGEKFLENTIQSVINQTYDNVEYIIIDGGSIDGTFDIIRKNQHAVDYWVSEKDRGIYDAMNKGIDLATGDWINFMNGGDRLFKHETLHAVFSSLEDKDADIFYGNHEVCYPSGRKRQAKAGLVKNLWKGSQFCHQATFVNSRYHKAHKFNLCTKIVADFEFFYLAWKNNAKFKHVPEIICSFEAGGVSDVKRIDSIVGWWHVVEKGLGVDLFYIMKIVFELAKKIIKFVKIKLAKVLFNVFCM